MYGGEDAALVVGSGKGRGRSGSVWEEGVKRAGPQRERDGEDSFPATADSIKQQYHTVFCVLKHTRSSYKPAIYVDSVLSFDASSGVYGGRTRPLRLEVERLGVGAAVFLGDGLRGQGHSEKRDGGDSFVGTANSIKQHSRTAFCALKHTRSSFKPAIYSDSGLSIDASSEVYGREGLAFAAGSDKLMGGRCSVFGEGVKRAGSQSFKSMNLGFKSNLFARIRYAVESFVESYVESSVEPRCKRRFKYVTVVPLSRYSTVLPALFRDDQVVMQPTMITLLLFLLSLLLLSLASSALSKLSLFFPITSDLNRHFGATSASLRIEDRALTQPLCSQAIHTERARRRGLLPCHDRYQYSTAIPHSLLHVETYA